MNHRPLHPEEIKELERDAYDRGIRANTQAVTDARQAVRMAVKMFWAAVYEAPNHTVRISRKTLALLPAYHQGNIKQYEDPATGEIVFVATKE